MDTSSEASRAGVRALFTTNLLEPQATSLIVDDPPTGVPIDLVTALGAVVDHVLVPKAAWTPTDVRNDIAPRPLSALASIRDCSVYCSDSPALNTPGIHNPCAHEPDPVVFSPGRGVYYVNAVPVDAVSLPPWLCSRLKLPPGSPHPPARSASSIDALVARALLRA